LYKDKEISTTHAKVNTPSQLQYRYWNKKVCLAVHSLTAVLTSQYAQIELRNGQVFLIDAKSTNGTQLNK